MLSIDNKSHRLLTQMNPDHLLIFRASGYGIPVTQKDGNSNITKFMTRSVDIVQKGA